MFDHLLGLNARSALAILAGYGITGVRVTQTGVRPIRGKLLTDGEASAGERLSLLDGLRRQFAVVEDDDGDEPADAPFDPLLDPATEQGMLTESRVVAVRDDGRQLIVARFRVGDPRPPEPDDPGAPQSSPGAR